MVLSDLSQEQRLRRAELAREVLRDGLLHEMTQGLTGNYIETLKNLAPSDNIGRDHLISRLCVLGDVMETVINGLHQTAGDGDVAIQEMKEDNG